MSTRKKRLYLSPDLNPSGAVLRFWSITLLVTIGGTLLCVVR